jgi:hypothetical protein
MTVWVHQALRQTYLLSFGNLYRMTERGMKETGRKMRRLGRRKGKEKVRRRDVGKVDRKIIRPILI